MAKVVTDLDWPLTLDGSLHRLTAQDYRKAILLWCGRTNLMFGISKWLYPLLQFFGPASGRKSFERARCDEAWLVVVLWLRKTILPDAW